MTRRRLRRVQTDTCPLSPSAVASALGVPAARATDDSENYPGIASTAAEVSARPSPTHCTGAMRSRSTTAASAIVPAG